MKLHERIKLRHLRHVLAVSEFGRMNIAADRLNISQAAVSKSLGEVEEIVGSPVFRRGHTGWVPTELGLRLIAFARRIVSEFDALEGTVGDLSAGVKGTVVIGIHAITGQLFIAETIARAKREYPGIVIRILEGVLPELIDDLRNGRVDLVFGRIGQLPLERDLESVGMVNEPMLVVASPQHPLSRRANLDWPTVLNASWILPLEGSPTRETLADYLVQQGHDLPPDRIDTKSYALLPLLLSAGAFLSIAPQSIAQHWAERWSVKILSLPLSNVETPIGLIWSRAQLLPAAKVLKDCFLKNLAERSREADPPRRRRAARG